VKIFKTHCMLSGMVCDHPVLKPRN